MRVKKEKQPKICGSYCLEAIDGNIDKIGWKYIGQSKNCVYRIYRHLLKLRNNKHKNPKLQAYYNKYGKSSFRTYILHKCKETELNFWEIFWIECFLKNRETKELVEFDSMLEFSEAYGITGIWHVLNGEINCLKNWYNPNGKWRPTYYKVIDPNGKEYEFSNIREFTNKHKLSYPSFNELIKKRIEHSQGWKRPDSKDTFPSLARHFDRVCSDYKFISPDGKLYTGKNITKFAKSQGLKQNCLSRVHLKQRKQYKGWRLYEDGKEICPFVAKDMNFYVIDPSGNIHLINNITHFAKENNLNRRCLCKLKYGKITNHQGWKLSKENV